MSLYIIIYFHNIYIDGPYRTLGFIYIIYSIYIILFIDYFYKVYFSIDGNNIIFIEWADFIKSLLPQKIKNISFEVLNDCERYIKYNE